MLVLDTPEAIEQHRKRTLLLGLRTEMLTGMKLTRGRTCYAIIKEEFGLRGGKEKVYYAFKKLIEG
jgi:hypothetical protein